MKPWRRKKRGKEYGNFYIGEGNGTVNLQTRNANEALNRARLFKRGEWKPYVRNTSPQVDEQTEELIREAEEAAAAAVDATFGHEDRSPAPSPTVPQLSPSSGASHGAGTGAPDPSSSSSAPSPSPSPPTTSSNPSTTPDWEAAAASAAEVDGGFPDGDAGAADDLPGIDPEKFLDELSEGLVQAAHVIGEVVHGMYGRKVYPPSTEKGQKLAALGDKLTAESVKQTIIRYLPASANVHPLWGLAAGVICIWGVQLAHSEKVDPSEASRSVVS